VLAPWFALDRNIFGKKRHFWPHCHDKDQISEVGMAAAGMIRRAAISPRLGASS